MKLSYIVIGVIALVAYVYFFPTRKKIAAYMTQKGYLMSTKIWEYDYGYIRAWYFGIKASKPTFHYDKKDYSIINGRAV